MFQVRQAGFSLVELMVAMAIGTVIILGAGQLFLTTFQTFDKVRDLSRKQESLVFITGVMVQDIRSAIYVDVELEEIPIEVLVPSRSSQCAEGERLAKRYFLSETGGNFSLSVRRRCNSESRWHTEPLVEGFYDDSKESFFFEDLGDGLYEMTIRLATQNGESYEEHMLRIQNRAEAFL